VIALMVFFLLVGSDMSFFSYFAYFAFVFVFLFDGPGIGVSFLLLFVLRFSFFLLACFVPCPGVCCGFVVLFFPVFYWFVFPGMYGFAYFSGFSLYVFLCLFYY